jgi:alkylation response protein AidB-like acyl-CoA dehydrogenase
VESRAVERVVLRSDSGASVVADSPEVVRFRREVRDKLASAFPPRDPHAHTMLSSAGYDLDDARRFLSTLDRIGLAAPHWPVEHGGLGLSPDMAEVIEQELASFDVPNLYPFVVALVPVAAAVIAHGTSDQQARWLGPIRAGEEVWCQLFSEPGAGSDLAAVSTRAELDGQVWRLTGSKVWASRATYSTWGFALARTDTTTKHGGLTTFALDMSAPGIDVRPLRQMNGLANFSEVFLDGAPVPDTDRIGDVNAGWSVVLSALSAERGSSGGDLGLSLERITDLAAVGAAASPIDRDRLARLVTAFKIAQWTDERVRAARRAGRPGPSGPLLRLQTGQLLKDVAYTAVDLAGVAETGWLGEASEWQAEFLTTPAVSIRAGTDEVQRNLIGERDLGLPREPKW